eukprot:scaffold3.g6602.t1
MALRFAVRRAAQLHPSLAECSTTFRWFGSGDQLDRKQQQNASGGTGPPRPPSPASASGGKEQQAAEEQENTQQPAEQPTAGQPDEQQQQGAYARGLDEAARAQLQAHVEQLQQLKGATRVQQQTLGGEGSSVLSWIATLFGGWMQNLLEGFVRERVERSFAATEFLEGAKDAYFIVNHLMGEHDWDALAPMVSRKFLDAIRGTVDEYAKAGLTWRSELQGEVDAGVRGVTFWRPEQIADLDPERASEGGEASLKDAPAGLWLVVNVAFHSRQRVTITRMDDANVVAGEGGGPRRVGRGSWGRGSWRGRPPCAGRPRAASRALLCVLPCPTTPATAARPLAELTDLRPQLLKFARGPLPPGPYPKEALEDVPWFLLTIA